MTKMQDAAADDDDGDDDKDYILGSVSRKSR